MRTPSRADVDLVSEVIDGLWALAVSPTGTLFFSAGNDDEHHGTLGTLSPVK